MKDIKVKKYLEKYTKMMSKSKEIIPFSLTKTQKELLDIIEKNNRIMLKKNHQIGARIAIVGHIYYSSIISRWTISVLAFSHIKDAKNVLDMVKTFNETTPKKIRPKLLCEKYGYNKYKVSFPESKSTILITSNVRDFHVGYTIQNAFIEGGTYTYNEEDYIAQLECSVPSNGKIIIDNSFSSKKSIFSKMWKNADNGYFKKEYIK